MRFIAHASRPRLKMTTTIEAEGIGEANKAANAWATYNKVNLRDVHVDNAQMLVVNGDVRYRDSLFDNGRYLPFPPLADAS